jgi:hypothetical protein
MEGSGEIQQDTQTVEESNGSPAPIQYPSVLVLRVPGENPGEENIRIAELNGIDPLSVPTVLRIAANIKQQQLGLP